MKLLTHFAIRKNGDSAFAGDVPSGLKCECTCAHCLEPLIAKHCVTKRSHFAHIAGSACSNASKTGETAPETQLHLNAKHLLSRIAFTLPSVRYGAHSSDNKNRTHAGWAHAGERVTIQPGSARVEQRLGHVIPDLIVSDGPQNYLIEVAVTHKVDLPKLLKIRELNLPTAELNLRHITYTENASADIERALRDEKNWNWVHHPLEKSLRARAKHNADQEAVAANSRYHEEAQAEQKRRAIAEAAKAEADRIALLARQAAAAARVEADRLFLISREKAAAEKAEEARIALLAWEAGAPARAEAEQAALLARQLQQRQEDEAAKRSDELRTAWKMQRIGEYRVLRAKDAAYHEAEATRRNEERQARRSLKP